MKAREILVAALRDFKNGGQGDTPVWEANASASAPTTNSAAKPAPSKPKESFDIEGLDMDADLQNVLGNL